MATAATDRTTTAAGTEGSELDRALATAPVVAIVRLPDDHGIDETLAAAARGGVAAMEVAMTTPGALDAVTRARTAGRCAGAGSVRTPADARDAIAAGAAFLVTPTTQPAVLAVAADAGVPVVCGGLTPTELDTAHQAGAAYVKLFPAGGVGPRYLRDVLAPLPDLRVVPTGGVDATTVPEWAAAGAVAVAAGSALVDPALVAAGDFDAIEARARALVSAWPSR